MSDVQPLSPAVAEQVQARLAKLARRVEDQRRHEFRGDEWEPARSLLLVIAEELRETARLVDGARGEVPGVNRRVVGERTREGLDRLAGNRGHGWRQ